GFIASLPTAVFAWPLLCLILLALHGLVLVWRRRPLAGWAVFGSALALGELSVGASAVWLMAAIAVAAPWATRYGRSAGDWRSWVGGLAGSIPISIAPPRAPALGGPAPPTPQPRAGGPPPRPPLPASPPPHES